MILSIHPIVNVLIGVALISAAKAHPPVQDERSADGNSPYPSALLLPDHRPGLPSPF